MRQSMNRPRNRSIQGTLRFPHIFRHRALQQSIITKHQNRIRYLP
jgi:hypothetical protein